VWPPEKKKKADARIERSQSGHGKRGKNVGKIVRNKGKQGSKGKK